VGDSLVPDRGFTGQDSGGRGWVDSCRDAMTETEFTTKDTKGTKNKGTANRREWGRA